MLEIIPSCNLVQYEGKLMMQPWENDKNSNFGPNLKKKLYGPLLWMSHFSERLYGRDLGQIGILGRNWHFRWGWFENFWYKKSWIRISSQKNGSNCNFYNFSLLVPYHNKFLVVGICILIFYGTYYPLPTNFFFCGGLFFFCVLYLGAGKISNFMETFCIGGT